jgi:manganese-transporting P-type ATPase
MSAVSTRPARSPQRTLSLRELPASSTLLLLLRNGFSHPPISSSEQLKLVDVKATSRETTLCLAGAHALVRLDDGTIVGDPMEKATLEALEWQIGNGDGVAPASSSAPHRTIVSIRRRFQFSSALKRMSTISTLPGGRGLVAVKGAPETIKTMLAHVPSDYDETYKWYTRRGSRVLALGMKEYDSISMDRVCFTSVFSELVPTVLSD